MKLAIMQPYFFPHIGYFQLISAVDTFVIYDDVNYIKGGWINRNYILSQGEPQRLTLSLIGAGSNRHINEITVGALNQKLLKTISENYSKAPYFQRTFSLIEEILSFPDLNLGRFLHNAIQKVCVALGISTPLVISSSIQKNNELRGVEKVVHICQLLGAKHYVNSPGGRALYNQEYFHAKNLELSFVETLTHSYKQFGPGFVPGLSIIDAMMFNSNEQMSGLLVAYELA